MAWEMIRAEARQSSRPSVALRCSGCRFFTRAACSSGVEGCETAAAAEEEEAFFVGVVVVVVVVVWYQPISLDVLQGAAAELPLLLPLLSPPSLPITAALIGSSKSPISRTLNGESGNNWRLDK